MSSGIMHLAAAPRFFAVVSSQQHSRRIWSRSQDAGLAAIVIEKKNQIDGSNAKPGDITVQQYHRGFASSAFDVTITHPLQQKYTEIAMEEEAHDRNLQKSLEVCQKEGIHFVPLA